VFAPIEGRLRILLTLACLVVIGAGIRVVAGPLVSILLAVVLAVAVLPLFDRLRRRGVAIAVAGTTLTLVGTIVVLIGFLGLAVTQLVRVVPSYQSQVQSLWGELVRILESRGIDPGRLASGDLIQPGQVLDLAVGMLSGVGSVLSTTLVLVILVAFALAEAGARKMTFGGETLAGRVARDVRQYLVITSVTGAGFAIACYLLWLGLGVDLAFVWAVLAFLLNFVPNVGSLLTMIPPALLALLEYGWQRALIAVAGTIVLNFVVDNLIKPRFMQTGLDVSPVIGLVSLILWSFLLGPVGALLAIPLTIAVRHALAEESPKPAG
jgi:predicted PurR-regulated permease PerM